MVIENLYWDLNTDQLEPFKASNPERTLFFTQSIHEGYRLVFVLILKKYPIIVQVVTQVYFTKEILNNIKKYETTVRKFYQELERKKTA